MSGTKCPNCNNAVKPGSSTQCDGCQSEMHLTCIGLNSEDIRITRHKSKSVKILCNTCNKYVSELQDIKNLILSVKAEFAKNITTLENKIQQLAQLEVIKDIKNSIDDIKKDLNEVKNYQPVKNKTIVVEEIIQEISERDKRKRNLMVFNLPEPKSTNSQERVLEDRTQIIKILNLANYSNDFKIIRLGGFRDGYHRPIKVILDSENGVHNIIKVARSLKNMQGFENVTLSFDRTPVQVDYYRQLRSEMNDRISKGETNLRIQYVNGRPTIKSLN